jgi:hypothetical protein
MTYIRSTFGGVNEPSRFAFSPEKQNNTVVREADANR